MADSIQASLEATKRLLASLQTVQVAASKSKPSSRTEAEVVKFVEVLQEKMGHSSAPLCRVHQPRKVKFADQEMASYTDICTSLAVNAYQVIVDVIEDPDKDFCDFPGYLEEPEQVTAKWPEIAKQLTKSGLVKLDLDKLLAKIVGEHQQAQPIAPQVPFIYQTKKKAIRPEVIRNGKKSKPEGMSDVVTFSPGEPDKRYQTKIGGVPFRAAEVPWPVTSAGRPMTFVAQFCFPSSEDLVGHLPGDVLLIFGEDENFCYPSEYGDTGRVIFEWYPLAEFPLLEPKKVPTTPWKIAPCHGKVERRTERKGVIQSTKIGGQPIWIQQGLNSAGRFLCALQGQEGSLEIADGGVLNFFLHENGQIAWFIDSF